MRFMEGDVALGPVIEFQWDNGRKQKLSAAFMRAQCPCENCKLAPIHLEPQMFPGLSAESVQPVGRYALQFQFSDGHGHGAYSFDLLLGWPDEA